MNDTNNIEHYQNQISLARTEIKNLRQQISALKHEHQKEVKLIKASLDRLRCAKCDDGAETYIHNGLAQSSASDAAEADDCIKYKPIGVIQTPFQNKRGVPRQPSVLNQSPGTIVIDPAVFNNPGHALDGLMEFSHMWIIFHFHETASNHVPAKVSPPRLLGERRGVFSTRSPHRPCPIGLSLVTINNIQGNKINFFGVDMVNGTPVLDVKPYIPQYDKPNDAFNCLQDRPLLEGVSDAATMANLHLDDDHTVTNRPNPSNTIETQVDTSDLLYQSVSTNIAAHVPYTPESPLRLPESPVALDAAFRSPMRRLDYERGAPDGQERFTPPQSAVNGNQDGIRVPSWIDNPPSERFEVHFTEEALGRLNLLIGDRAQAFKTDIEKLLSEDPRSNYVRGRYPAHEFSCLYHDLSISCVFDDESLTCTIVSVMSADDDEM